MSEGNIENDQFGHLEKEAYQLPMEEPADGKHTPLQHDFPEKLDFYALANENVGAKKSPQSKSHVLYRERGSDIVSNDTGEKTGYSPSPFKNEVNHTSSGFKTLTKDFSKKRTSVVHRGTVSTVNKTSH